MIDDSFIHRIKMKARANQLCIAVGSLFSGGMDLPTMANEICSHFNVKFSVSNQYEWYTKWNQFIDKVEKKNERQKVWSFVIKKKESTKPKSIHRKIATIPVSNFIDISLDRRLLDSLKELGRQPVSYDFTGGLSIGSWKQRNPDTPNVFSAFRSLQNESKWYGLHQQLTLNAQDRI